MEISEAFHSRVGAAIAYVRNWRESQNLDALSSQDERDAASRLIIEKGYNLPNFIPDVDGSLKLKEGIYMKTEEVTLSIEVQETEPDAALPEKDAKNIAPEIAPSPLFAWSPNDAREFWCEKLQSFVRMSGDLNADGTYWVIKSGEGNFRRWPAKSQELILKDQAPASVPQSDFLLVNSAKWSDIKDCLVNKFISSYPWSKKGDKQPNQIREEMLSLAKSRKQGLASFIEEERKLGRFEDPQNFTLRMNTVYESFPWGDFTQMLDFN